MNFLNLNKMKIVSTYFISDCQYQSSIDIRVQCCKVYYFAAAFLCVGKECRAPLQFNDNAFPRLCIGTVYSLLGLASIFVRMSEGMSTLRTLNCDLHAFVNPIPINASS